MLLILFGTCLMVYIPLYVNWIGENAVETQGARIASLELNSESLQSVLDVKMSHE